MIEIFLKITFTRAHFLSHKMEMFDAFIVVLSFIFDLVSLYDEDFNLGQLLIIWRVVRLINGLILSAKQAADKRNDTHYSLQMFANYDEITAGCGV